MLAGSLPIICRGVGTRFEDKSAELWDAMGLGRFSDFSCTASMSVGKNLAKFGLIMEGDGCCDFSVTFRADPLLLVWP